jgi:hypothetical protein
MDRCQPGSGDDSATRAAGRDQVAVGTELARVLQRASDSSPELAGFLVLAAATGARSSALVRCGGATSTSPMARCGSNVAW